jgi:hypothetical protein
MLIGLRPTVLVADRVQLVGRKTVLKLTDRQLVHRRKLQWTGDWRTIDWRVSGAIITVLRGVGSKVKVTTIVLEQIAAL